MKPLLSLTEHLALYTAFHRGPGNRAVHAICMPLIFLSGGVFFALVKAAAPVALAMVALLALVDRRGALVMGAWLVPVALAASAALDLWPFVILAPLMVVVHLAAWALTVRVGHLRFEPTLRVQSREEDSNLYFRQHYFTASGLGVAVRLTDRAVQFCIAPLSVTHDLLVWLGFRRDLEARIVRARAAILERLSRGDAPLGAQP